MKGRSKKLAAMALCATLVVGNVSTAFAAETTATGLEQSTEGSEAAESVKDTEAAESTENTEATESTEKTKDTEATESTEKTQDTEVTEGSETTESTENTEVTESTEEVKDTETTEASEEEETQAVSEEEVTEETEVKEAGSVEVTITDASGKTVSTQAVSTDAAGSGLQKIFDYIRDNASADNIMTVKLPAGTYSVEKTVDIYSNTTLDLSAGVTLKRTGTSSLIRFGRSDEMTSGYEGFKNISIVGSASSYATLDGNAVSTSIVRFAHADNVKLQYIKFTNVTAAHHMEFAGSKNVVIDHCKFDGFKAKSSDDTTNYEAIQLDILNETHFGNYGNYDNTVCKDITISNNTFENVNRGVGSHSGEIGRYFTGVTISGNTFKNVTGYAIVTTNYIGAKITDNKIENCGAGIFFRHITPTKHYFPGDVSNVTTDCASEITGNMISIKKTGFDNAPYGIKVFGKVLESDVTNSFKDESTGKSLKVTIPKGDYRVKNVTVSGNKVTVNSVLGYGLWFQGTYESTLSGNSVTYAGSAVNGDESDGIKLEASASNTVSQNTVTDESKGIMRNGIYVKGACDATALSQNTISNTKNNGIYVFDSVGCSVEGNNISNTGKHGIYADSKAGSAKKMTAITGNIIKKTANRGICVNDNSYAEVSENQISSTGDDGIYAGSKAQVSLKSNSIASAKNQGIYINSGAKATEISGNTITGSSQNGIYVNQKSAGGVINQNKITDSGKHGIYVNVSTADQINGNTIAKASAKNGSVRGICINGSGTSVAEVSDNNISKCSEHGIMVSDKAAVKVIQRNVIKTVGKYGIYVNQKTKVTTVASNKITSAKSVGICVNVDKTNLKENVIKKCKTVIHVQATKKFNPGNVKIKSISASKGKLTLKWAKVKGASKYTVYRSEAKDGTYKKVGTTKNLSYADKKVKKGKTYFYKVLPTANYKKVVVEGTGTVKKAKATK